MSKKQIFEQLKFLALALNADVTPEVLHAYTELFRDANIETFKIAIKRLSMESLRYPLPAQINAMLTQNVCEIDGNIEAGSIIQSIKTYGWSNQHEAQQNLSPIAWQAVEMFGGWQQLCSITNEQLQSTRAQLRDLITALSKKEISARKNNLIANNGGLKKLEFGG
jgi:hypothetical protein